MNEIELRYGGSRLPFPQGRGRFDVLAPSEETAALTDVELGDRLDCPIDSPPLDEVVSPGESVLIVVPDATRRSGAGQVVNLLVRRLIAAGTMPHEIAVLIATGIHRGVTEEEKREILTPFIVQRLKVHGHRAKDLMEAAGLASGSFSDHGTVLGDIPVRLNSKLSTYDRVITVGSVAFHYFAGFTGGRKLICPGVAAEETIAATHRLAFDFERLQRREGVGPGRLTGNPVHEAFIEAASKRPPDFSVNTVVNGSGEVTGLYCGHWRTSHEEACRIYAAANTVAVSEKRDLVIASCGGFPGDINMIQAHKALDGAAEACREGGRIVLLAECRDGLGSSGFAEWFSAGDSDELASRLRDGYQVNGQTAWALLRKAERFDLRMVTSLDAATVSSMRMRKEKSLEEALDGIGPDAAGYILPNGARTLIRPE
jgi:nickel-dependent lactate racemase